MKAMEISYDPEKRAKTLAERGLDFEDAVQVFAGTTFTIEDDRQDYGEQRFQTMGFLGDRLVMIVWTHREGGRHIISMRKCNDREKERFETRVGRPR
jgi:uncharacterized DUF497 family protein